MTRRKIKIEMGSGSVSAVLDRPSKVVGAIALAHGAGAGMNHEFMVNLAAALTSRGFAVLRYQFPYMEAGRKRVDSPRIATATIAAAVSKLATLVPGVSVFAAGKSFGARMTTTAAAHGLLEVVDGLICYGLPLHPAGKPGVSRAEHLAEIRVNMLLLQGTRDALADLKLMKKVCKKLSRAQLVIIEGADHGFSVLKRSGRTLEDVLDELADASIAFARRARSPK